jgi:hypothetical protein
MFSRRDPRPSFAVQRVDSAEHHRVTPKTGGGTGFGSIMLCARSPGWRFASRGLRNYEK